MKPYRSLTPVLMVMLAVLMACASAGKTGGDVPRMTADDLKAMLDDPDIVILDTRRAKDWSSSDVKIKGAVYADPERYDDWRNSYPKEKKIVLYCA